jgi:nicotinate dehydrogenase subunit B
LRLRHIEEAREKAVLPAAAGRAKWDIRPSPKKGKAGDTLSGRGVAIALRGGTAIAAVQVNKRIGAICVKKLNYAYDCGLIVNPDALRGTVQANRIQSVGRILKEEVTFGKTSAKEAFA